MIDLDSMALIPNLRTWVLASSVLEAMNRFSAGDRSNGVVDQLQRAKDFPEAVAAFCQGQFYKTEDGLTSAEAFSAFVASDPKACDPHLLGCLVQSYAEMIDLAIKSSSADLGEAGDVFSLIMQRCSRR